MSDLPEGFVEHKSAASDLPEGFVEHEPISGPSAPTSQAEEAMVDYATGGRERLSRAEELGKKISIPTAIMRGATPPALASLVKSAPFLEKAKNWQELVNKYHINKEEFEKEAEEAEAAHPFASVVGNMLPALATYPIGGAIVPEIKALGALSGVPRLAAGALLQRSAETGPTVQTLKNTAADVALGGAFGGAAKLAEAAAQPVYSAGRAGATARNIGEHIESKLGNSAFGKWAGAAAPDVKTVSPRIADLQAKINAPKFGKAAAAAEEEGIRNLGDMASKRLAALTPTEIKNTADTMANLWRARGAKDVNPDQWVANWDEFVAGKGLNPQKDSVEQLIRTVNGRDPAMGASMLSNMHRDMKTMGFADKMIPQAKEMFKGAEGSRAEYLSGKTSRLMHEIQPGEKKGIYQFAVESIPKGPPEPMEELARKMALDERVSIGDSGHSYPPDYFDQFADMSKSASNAAALKHEPKISGMNLPLSEMQSPMEEMRLRAGKQEGIPASQTTYGTQVGDNGLRNKTEDMLPHEHEAYSNAFAKAAPEASAARKESFKKTIDRVIELRKILADEKAAPEIAKKAQAELESILRGREALKKMIGWGAAGTALAAGEPLVAGAMALGVKPVGEGMLRGLEKWGQFGDMAVNEGGWIQRLARQPGAAGNIAKNVINGSAAGFAARLGAAMRMPNFQAAAKLEQEKDQQSP